MAIHGTMMRFDVAGFHYPEHYLWLSVTVETHSCFLRCTGAVRCRRQVQTLEIRLPSGSVAVEVPPMTYKQVVIRSAGGSDRLEFESLASLPPELEGPTPEGCVDIRVLRSGVNFADTAVRQGLYASAKKYEGVNGTGFPIVPGFEVAGEVVGVGEGVSGRTVGEQVLAVSRFKCYASRLRVASHLVFSIPKGWNLSEAAGLPAAALTAAYALELGDVWPRKDHRDRSKRLLVHSAAGGVGSFLVQLAKAQGHFVVGIVGRQSKRELVQSFNADVVIHKEGNPKWKAEAVEAAGAPLVPGERSGYDAIFDANGVSTLSWSFENLGPCGRLVVYGFHSMLPKSGSVWASRSCCSVLYWLYLAYNYLRTPAFNPLDMTASNRSVMAFNLSFLFDFEVHKFVARFENILKLANEGKLKTPPVRVFPAPEARSAHDVLESGNSVGKLVLEFE
uniref:Enoyl reductase (ER) domain-containing protein n=1 Tax=Chromera velia CCMP2878 TaxID=1169474 RepID=A0A0G4H944_9ALVE|eukprot:Cvel_25313.t1-p1 / transcript=Cvel_25313.t1 / gene=Cvel_25313 / organism=Chromera_velia_CCMP2878 / gene_product=Synaptic vesicle membrane protein VAT-1 homolog, putative / transcript_product=Synaptic vesicle membrane protein VAT-1 homolog, putative / location=Cvel_scaffold2849:21454-22794(-) / protein_length=447 / sequence_SO=supercontig / SO=protein_coding / is_pseudo=false